MAIIKKQQYPSAKLVVPAGLKGVKNGELDGTVLRKVKCGGRMFVDAAKAFNIMYDAALEAGVILRNVGDYRSLDAQLGLFKERYSTSDEGRKPQVTRSWDNKVWFLKKGCSPCSTPGKSNHGLGLAIDLDVTNKKVLTWLCANAPSYGFFMQSSDPKSPEFEAWHWQYCGVGK